MKNMKLMKKKTKSFIIFMFFMVINNLFLSLYSQVYRLKEIANKYHLIHYEEHKGLKILLYLLYAFSRNTS